MFQKENKAIKTMERNIVSKNTKIVGELKAEGDFRIDGILEGNLTTTGRVIIGLDGFIKGSIQCENADIEGKFSGNLKVNKMLTLKATALVSGEIIVGKLAVEPGATFNASCAMKGAIKEMNKSNEKGTAAEKTA